MNRLQADVDALLRLELIGHMLTDHSWDGFVHDHSFLELVYVLKGPVKLWAEDESITLQTGEMILVPEGMPHRIISVQPASFLYLGFKTNLIHASEHAMKVFHKEQTADLSVFAVHCEDMVEKAFSQGVSLTEFAPQFLAFLIPALCSLEYGRVEQDPKEILSNKVKQYIKRNYQKPIRVSEIAASLYHSPHYIGNVFAQVNGMTIKEYTLQYKMQKALWLLQNANTSVADIAGRLGYDSAHYFSKCFKSYFGFTPSEIQCKMER